MNWTEAEYAAYCARHQPARSQDPPASRSALAEAALLAQVRQLAQQSGLPFYHTRDSRGSDKGWPDCAILRPHDALILCELKTATGKLRPEQAMWLSVLQTVTRVETVLLRPADLPWLTARLTQRREG